MNDPTDVTRQPHSGETVGAGDTFTANRRGLLTGGLISMGTMAAASWVDPAMAKTAGPVTSTLVASKPGAPLPLRPSTVSGKSEWGYHTAQQPTPQPVSFRTGEEVLPVVNPWLQLNSLAWPS